MYKRPIRDIHDVVVLERYLQRRTYEEISLLKRTYEEIEEMFDEILEE